MWGNRFSNSNLFAFFPSNFKCVSRTGTLPFLRTREQSLSCLIAEGVYLLVDLYSICLQFEFGLFVESLLDLPVKTHSVLDGKVWYIWLGGIYYFACYHHTQGITLCLPALAYLSSTFLIPQKTDLIHSKYLPFSAYYVAVSWTVSDCV